MFACRGFKGGTTKARGEFRSRQTLPIDERFINHWNYDPWTIDGRGKGQSLADGTSFLLPYYMGRYFGFILDTTSPQNGAQSQAIARSGEALIASRSAAFRVERKLAHAFFDRTRRFGFSRIESSLSRNRAAKS